MKLFNLLCFNDFYDKNHYTSQGTREGMITLSAGSRDFVARGKK